MASTVLPHTQQVEDRLRAEIAQLEADLDCLWWDYYHSPIGTDRQPVQVQSTKILRQIRYRERKLEGCGS